MDLEPGDRTQLPVACALGPSDGAARLDEWRQVLREAGIGTERRTGELILRFENVDGLGDRLTRLVAQERDCCGFLGWDLICHDGEWRIRITGTDEQLGTLSITN